MNSNRRKTLRMPKNREEADALMRAIYGDTKWEAYLAAKARSTAKMREREKQNRDGKQ